MARIDAVDVGGLVMRVHVALPAGGGSRSGVVVMCHGPGLDDFIENRVESLARAI